MSRQLGLPITYLVADARRLPFRDDCVDTVFSYSVFQHFKKPDVCASLAEIGRVLKPGRTSLVQMASAWGVRNLHSRLMRLIENIASDLARRPRSPDRFDVRYWRPRELKDTFARCIGPSILIVDGFFGLNVQESDTDLLPRAYRAVVRTSGLLRRLSEWVPAMKYGADSLYIESFRKLDVTPVDLDE